MTPDDVARLYTLLSELRKEAASDMAGLQQEVRGFREDLNSRLTRLEIAEARRDGIGDGRGSVGRVVVSVAATAAAVGSVCGAIVALL